MQTKIFLSCYDRHSSLVEELALSIIYRTESYACTSGYSIYRSHVAYLSRATGQNFQSNSIVSLWTTRIIFQLHSLLSIHRVVFPLANIACVCVDKSYSHLLPSLLINLLFFTTLTYQTVPLAIAASTTRDRERSLLFPRTVTENSFFLLTMHGRFWRRQSIITFTFSDDCL